jgi:hypothetical protein
MHSHKYWRNFACKCDEKKVRLSTEISFFWNEMKWKKNENHQISNLQRGITQRALRHFTHKKNKSKKRKFLKKILKKIPIYFNKKLLFDLEDRGSLDRISLDRITWSKFSNKIGVWSKLCFITWSKFLIILIFWQSLDQIISHVFSWSKVLIMVF